jgi:hypothetical protein
MSGLNKHLLEERIIIPYKPRAQFIAYHNRQQRRAIMVCHRRAGKTVATINDLIKRALLSENERPRVAYIAPLFKQAKAVAWDYLKHFTHGIRGVEANEAELRVDLPNEGQVRLYGADNPDALRGIYLDDVVLDEYAQMRPSLWPQVIRPTLADRRGSATFIGTPRGRNEFCALYQHAVAHGDEWFSSLLKASESGLLAKAELDDAMREMGPDEYAQEFECSFDAAIKGAYYGGLMNDAQADGRICRVAWEPALPVHTAWDLGIGDSTAIWFYQVVGNEVRLIDFLEMSGMALPWYVTALEQRKAKGWIFGEHNLPHDAEVRELGTGKSRVDTLRSLGIFPRILPALPVDDGISAVRLMLPRCWFAEEACADGIEHLRQYKREWDERLRTFRPKPLHDEHSHAADALRYLAMSLDPGMGSPQQSEDRYGRRTKRQLSWMGV